MKITIITAVKNGAETIWKCLESVSRQKTEIEHLIIDGGSTDRTCEIIKSFADTELVRHILIQEPDRGIYDAMNKGINRATGDVVGILNADDVYAGEHVLADVKTVFEGSSVDACYGDIVCVSAGNPDRIVRRWKAGKFGRNRFLWGWMPPHPSFFVRKEIYKRLGGFRLDLDTSADYELMLRFLYRHEISTGYLPATLVKMRYGGASSRSIEARIRANRMDRNAWKVNGLRPYLWTLWFKPLRKVFQFIV